MPAINYYQPWLRPFLQSRKNSLPPGIKSYYYYSFEDGLWDVLANKFPPGRQLTCLVPDFYCLDVVNNLTARGHKIVFYPLDKHFQISGPKLGIYINRYQPEVVVVFHPCGITAKCLQQPDWNQDLPRESVIIEDWVHRLVNPEEIKLTDDRHIVIDSLRKVSPLPGSRIFGSERALNFSQAENSHFNLYVARSLSLYILFRLTLKAGLQLIDRGS